MHAWIQMLPWMCRWSRYMDDGHTHVIVNAGILPLASKPKAPKYTARTRTARTSQCPSTIPSGTGWQPAWMNAAKVAAAAARKASLRAASLSCRWRLSHTTRQKWKKGSFGSMCRGTCAPTEPRLPSGPKTHVMQELSTPHRRLCTQSFMDVALTYGTSTRRPSGPCGKQLAKTSRKRRNAQWEKGCLQRAGSAACS